VRTIFIEATQNIKQGPNHGKFMIAMFDGEEWKRPSALGEAVGGMGAGGSLLRRCRLTPRDLLVMDLQTGEAAVFCHGGFAMADLGKRRVWVCPLFEPFLNWLYKQPLERILRGELPPLIELPDAAFELYGHRRPGPEVGEEGVEPSRD
jgi:hypothetical protein